MNSLIVGIDASRNRSGGARAHLQGILAHLNPKDFGITTVHLWSHPQLLASLPDYPWLIKHAPAHLQRGLLSQLWWQYRTLKHELRRHGCQILFTSDASSLCTFSPAVVLSQDLLSYEPQVRERYPWGWARLRLWAIGHVQNRAFRQAQGVIFLTQYAAQLILRSCGALGHWTVIPHGVAPDFMAAGQARSVSTRELARSSGALERDQPAPAMHCLYISNAAIYKYQWVVIEAVARLRERGHPLTLTLVGGGSGPAQARIEAYRAKFDPQGIWVTQHPFVPPADLITHFTQADLFVFASGCEAFGITLLEAMAVGLPIAASERSSISETLGDGGVYFDPEQASSIASAIEALIVDSALRDSVATRARALASAYSWSRCANETWSFIVDTYRQTPHS